MLTKICRLIFEMLVKSGAICEPDQWNEVSESSIINHATSSGNIGLNLIKRTTFYTDKQKIMQKFKTKSTAYTTLLWTDFLVQLVKSEVEIFGIQTLN
jgi:hypothetical protein